MRGRKLGRWATRVALLAALGAGVVFAGEASATDDVGWGMADVRSVSLR